MYYNFLIAVFFSRCWLAMTDDMSNLERRASGSVYMYIHIDAYTYLYVCIYVCIYVYIYTYITVRLSSRF